MAIKNLPKYKDIRNSIRRKGRYPYVGTAVKDTHVIHHSMTAQHLKGSNPNSFANTHIDTNGWSGIAYPFVIMPDGTIYQTDDLDRRTNHAGNTNTRSIGTCLVGDFRKEGAKEKPTKEQLESLYLLNKELFKELPNMKYVKGHQECPGYSWKNCPGDMWDYRDAIAGKGLSLNSDKPVTVEAPKTEVKTEVIKKPSNPAPKGKIEVFQDWLNNNYKTGIAEDNIYGKNTKKAASKALQTELNKQYKAGLVVDGIWGPKTKAAIRTVSRGAKGNITRIVQGMLYSFGYDPKGFDGIFGDGCFYAVMKFQRDKKLSEDGKCGKNTFEAMFK